MQSNSQKIKMHNVIRYFELLKILIMICISGVVMNILQSSLHAESCLKVHHPRNIHGKSSNEINVLVLVLDRPSQEKSEKKK